MGKNRIILIGMDARKEEDKDMLSLSETLVLSMVSWQLRRRLISSQWQSVVIGHKLS